MWNHAPYVVDPFADEHFFSEQAVIGPKGDLVKLTDPALQLTSNLIRDQYGALAEMLWPRDGTRGFSAVPDDGRRLLTHMATHLPDRFWEQSWFQELRLDAANKKTSSQYDRDCGNVEPWIHLLCAFKFGRNCFAHCSYADLTKYASKFPPELAQFAFSGKIDAFLRSFSRPVEQSPAPRNPSGKGGEGGRSGSKGRGPSRPGASSQWSPIRNPSLGAAWAPVSAVGTCGGMVIAARQFRSVFTGFSARSIRLKHTFDAVSGPAGLSPPLPSAGVGGRKMKGGRVILRAPLVVG